jgi:hypothetical protein
MYAVVIPVTFIDRSAAEGELDGLVSRVSGSPEFVAGYWVALSQERGTSMVVFNTEEAAQALATMARSAPAVTVTTGEIEVGEVMAHA